MYIIEIVSNNYYCFDHTQTVPVSIVTKHSLLLLIKCKMFPHTTVLKQVFRYILLLLKVWNFTQDDVKMMQLYIGAEDSLLCFTPAWVMMTCSSCIHANNVTWCILELNTFVIENGPFSAKISLFTQYLMKHGLFYLM